MMTERIISIKDRYSGELLASAPVGKGTELFEGAWYFDREHVDMANLVITERTYICPYKGTCYWIDLKAADHQAQDVGFTYFDVKLGYEFIQDKIGLYAGEREATVQEAAVQTIGESPSK